MQFWQATYPTLPNGDFKSPHCWEIPLGNKYEKHMDQRLAVSNYTWTLANSPSIPHLMTHFIANYRNFRFFIIILLKTIAGILILRYFEILLNNNIWIIFYNNNIDAHPAGLLLYYIEFISAHQWFLLQQTNLYSVAKNKK